MSQDLKLKKVVTEDSPRKMGKLVEYKYKQSEINFIINFASVLVQNTFARSKVLSVVMTRSVWKDTKAWKYVASESS
jgi:hypothetical protein